MNMAPQPAVSVPLALPMKPGLVVALAAMLAAFFVFSNLGVKPLHDWDEAWDAIVALDVVRTGRLLTYTEDGELTSMAVRPPLHFWAMAAAFKLLGPTEFAARVFSAGCYVGLVALVAWFCVRRLNWTVALVAALLLSTHELLVYHHGARSADSDPPLVLFLSATMLGVYGWRCGRRSVWLPLAWAAALLTKGPAALQIVPVIVLWRAWRGLAQVLVMLVAGSIPLAVFLLLREQRQPGVLLFTGGESLARVLISLDGTEWRPLVSLGKLLESAVPVLLSLGVACAAVRLRSDLTAQLAERAERRRLLRFLLLWWLVPTALFSVVRTQKIWYFYASLVPACVLAAWVLRASLRRLECAGRTRVAGVATAILLVAMVAPAAWRSVITRRGDLKLAGEYADMVSAIRLAEPAPLLAYRLYPADRFVLHRAGLAYQPVGSPEALATLLAAPAGRVLVAYRGEDTAAVDDVLKAQGAVLRLRLPQRGTELVEVSAGR